MSNIYFIGMPGSGKTTLAKLCGEKLEKRCLDVDQKIEDCSWVPVGQTIDTYGIDHFRHVESQMLDRLSHEKDCIISTGGGIVLDRINVVMMKDTGKIIFIDSNLDALKKRINYEGRPLVTNEEDLKKLYDERIDIYNSNCDVKFENNEEDIDAAADKLVEIIKGLN